MQNFMYYAPTKVHFGKGMQHKVGEIIKSYGYQKILLMYGGGSIVRTGLYDQVVDSLSECGIAYTQINGVTPNPKLAFVKKAIALCRMEKVELILAVGGGSVIDAAKVTAIGAVHHIDPWKFSQKEAIPTGALPVGTILTLAASGSEMSASAVITNEEGLLKRGFGSDYNRPLFSILNPELTFTVDPYQTACGIVDILMHTMERYFSIGSNTQLTDGIALTLMASVIAAGARVMIDPQDYEARATLMWAGSLSHNDLTGVGRSVFMPCHQIEHEVSGMYDFVAHGAGLAVVFPAWAKYVYKENPARFAQFASHVWGYHVDFENLENAAEAGIAATEKFFAQIGMPIRLSQLGIGEEKFEELAEKCTFFGKRTLAGQKTLGQKEIIEIFTLAK